MNDRGIVARIIFIILLLSLSWMVLIGMLAYLQLGNHKNIRYTYTSKTLGMRGTIYDRNGTKYPMAASMNAWRIFLNPREFSPSNDVPAISRILGEKLGIPAREIEEKFSRVNAKYIKLGDTADRETYEWVRTNKMTHGVGADQIIVRRYPHGRCMSHVLGYVNAEGVGGEGIEQRYNRYLTGTGGLIMGEKNAHRDEIFMRRQTSVDARAGHNIHLTLDHSIQEIVEKVLAETVSKFNAAHGWSMVQEVKSGELLAMASYPNYAPEQFKGLSDDVRRNYALTTVYEPGSIMKAVSVAAWLNEGLGTPATLVNAEQGAWSYGGSILHDHVTGPIDITTAIKKSSNIVTAKLALQLGDNRLYRYFRAFNFGSKFGFDLPGESRGMLPNPKNPRAWSKLTPTRISIGQGVAVTALQMISAYSCIANDGAMMKPYLISKVVSEEGEVVYQNTPEVIGRPISKKTARQMQKMLATVTSEMGGTGRRARIRGYSVAGKTGTSQKVENGQYSKEKHYASFVGFVPAGNPVFTVLVSIDQPSPQHTGGYVAAPAFSAIAEKVARYLEVPPDIEEDYPDVHEEEVDEAGFQPAM